MVDIFLSIVTTMFFFQCIELKSELVLESKSFFLKKGFKILQNVLLPDISILFWTLHNRFMNISTILLVTQLIFGSFFIKIAFKPNSQLVFFRVLVINLIRLKQEILFLSIVELFKVSRGKI